MALLLANVLPLVPYSIPADMDSEDIKLIAIELLLGLPKIRLRFGAAQEAELLPTKWLRYPATEPINSERREISIFMSSRYERRLPFQWRIHVKTM